MDKGILKNERLREFMAHFQHEGLTFDDVSLVTRYSDFLPDQADVSTQLTTGIRLNLPFVGAAMDTVTEDEMAIALALLGGIGIIHKNMNIRDQARQVGNVKHHLHGLIRNPVVFKDSDTIKHVLDTKVERGFNFTGFPIVDSSGKFVGILTSTDMKYSLNTGATVAEVMTSNVITAAPDTGLQDAYRIMVKNKIGKLPLVENSQLVGLYSFTDVRTIIENVQPMYNRDAKYRLRVGAAVSGGDHERVEALANEEIDVVVVDSAHGHSKNVLDMIRWIKTHYPAIEVIGGNVATGEGACAIRDAGANAVKVGIGPGSICTTRVVCGVGVPQITAVYAAARALEDSVPVIADGGIRHSGDVPKALLAGAHSVMLGSILAGTEESPGEKIIHQGRQYVMYRGMGSLAAMREGKGSRERYSQSNTSDEELVPQGVEGIVPYAGSVKKVLTQFAGGLKSSLGYCGCRTLADLQTNGRFVRVSFAGVAEAHPHDIKIMKEAPNYRSGSGN